MKDEYLFADTATVSRSVHPLTEAVPSTKPIGFGRRGCALPWQLSVAAVLLLTAAGIVAVVQRFPLQSEVHLAEPAVAAQFVTAYSHVDEQSIAPLVSPLYRAELGRRGYADRLAFLPVPWNDDVSPPTIPWLEFTYVDGIVDRYGFTRLLYVVRSKITGGSRMPTTVWRVDLDPDGRVIWGEMVFGFGEAVEFSAERTTDIRLDALPSIPLSPSLRPLWPHLQPQTLLTITSSEGHRYYALGLTPKKVDAAVAREPAVVIFFATDEEGRVLPGAWSYGKRVYRYDGQTAAKPVIPIPVTLEEQEEALLLQYLLTLW